MTERKGSLIRWKAECGHWMVCYSLEPTPEACPDCVDESTAEVRSLLKYWLKDIDSADAALMCAAVDDVPAWLKENGFDVPADVVTEMQAIADECCSAGQSLNAAARRARQLMDNKLPKAERLTMPEAS